MSIYFTYFPKTTHTNQLVVDITRRVNFRNTVFNDPYAFLPYTIVNDDRPEDIAYYYYGDVKYTWIVYLSNQIIDPYHQWPLSNEKFEKYLIKKYAEKANTTGYQVISWIQDQTSNTNIIHYRNIDDNEIIISPETFNLDENLIENEWEPIRFYDYEFEKNENYRIINLLDKRYVKQAEKELKVLMNGTVR